VSGHTRAILLSFSVAHAPFHGVVWQRRESGSPALAGWRVGPVVRMMARTAAAGLLRSAQVTACFEGPTHRGFCVTCCVRSGCGTFRTSRESCVRSGIHQKADKLKRLAPPVLTSKRGPALVWRTTAAAAAHGPWPAKPKELDRSSRKHPVPEHWSGCIGTRKVCLSHPLTC